MAVSTPDKQEFIDSYISRLALDGMIESFKECERGKNTPLSLILVLICWK